MQEETAIQYCERVYPEMMQEFIRCQEEFERWRQRF